MAPCAADKLAKSDPLILRHLPDAFDWYEAKLREANALDFDDLLSLTVAVLRDEARYTVLFWVCYAVQLLIGHLVEFCSKIAGRLYASCLTD